MAHSDRPNPETIVLDNGLPAATATAVSGALEQLGIRFKLEEHPAIYTVAQSQQIHGHKTGAFTKNLFLRNKKGLMWIVTLVEDRQIDLKALASLLEIKGGLSFASTERMMKFLGVVPGSVTPLALFNDHSHRVEQIIDAKILDQTTVHLHPCRNYQTLEMATKDLLVVLEAWEHPARIVNFD